MLHAGNGTASGRHLPKPRHLLTQRLPHLDQLPRHRQRVELHDVRQDDRVGNAVRDVKEGADRMRHRVDVTEPRGVERHPGEARRHEHIRHCAMVPAVGDRWPEICADEADGMERERLRERCGEQ